MKKQLAKIEPKRVLTVLGGEMAYGGIELFVMNHLRHFNRQKVIFDFIIHGSKIGVFDEELKEYGCKIYFLPVKSQNPIKYFYELNQFFKKNKYDIVHSHMDAMNTTILRYAKKNGVNLRISHSHNTNHLTKNPIKYLLNEFMRHFSKRYATHLFACSVDAFRWLYKKELTSNLNESIIPNAIKLDQFRFSKEHRSKIRAKYKISSNTLLIGHVGRFDYQKNHEFIINIFKNLLLAANNKKFKIAFIGIGPLKQYFEEKAIEYNLQANIIFLGKIGNPSYYYSAFDVFILPSLFEGLPLTLVEAQANDLPCLISENISRDAVLTDKVKQLNINSYESWVNELLKFEVRKDIQTNNNSNRLENYDIVKSSIRLQNFYNNN